MIKTMKGSAVDLYEKDNSGALIHVCNNHRVQGSGIALEIKNRYPNTFKVYHDAKTCNLGDVSYHPSDMIFNMVAQDNFSGITPKTRHLHYGALAVCLEKVAVVCSNTKVKTIYIPVLMGALRAGGDWGIVREMVEFILADFDIVYCDFGVK